MSCKVRCTCGPASGCTVSPSAPAFTKSSIKGSTGEIIRCTSSGFFACGFIALTTAGPMEMLGTKWPAMTSTWIRSAPAFSIASISAPRRAKSADRIEGAIRTGLAIGRLSDGFFPSPQGRNGLKTEEHHGERGPPHHPRLIAEMGTGKDAAEKGVAKQRDQHESGQSGLFPTSRSRGPPQEPEQEADRRQRHRHMHEIERQEPEIAALLIGAIVVAHLRRNRLAELRRENPF